MGRKRKDIVDTTSVPSLSVSPSSLIFENPIDEFQYYKGNKKVPKSEAQFEWTPKMVQELRKCKEDIVYFAENYFYIVNLDRGKEVIKLYTRQRQILKSLSRERFLILLSSRQFGKCFCINTLLKIRNKKTGEIEEISVGDLFEISKISSQNTTTNQKIIETHNLTDYEIWTDTGWEELDAIHKTIEYQVWEIHTQDFNLKCADEHIVFGKGYKEIFVKDLQVGDTILTEKGLQKITSIKVHNDFENMYDVSLVNGNHRFYSNGILSHNTTLMTIYALWLSCFENDQRIVIVANREQTAINIYKRIRTAFEQLPNFLKPGVKEYGQTGVTFDNDSSIGVSTTTATAVRGESISCLVIDEMAFIECLEGDTVLNLKDKKLKTEQKLFIKDLYNLKNTENFLIETPKGWKSFKEVKRYNKRVLYSITTEKNKSVVVSANHAFLDKNNNKILCKNCLNEQIQTKEGLERVIKKEKIGKNYVYDLVDVESDHTFYANEILHHNTHLIEDFWSSVIPVVSSGKRSKIFAVSTPNGTDNKFYEVYSNAEKGKSAWKAERVDWWDIPGRTEKWKQQQIQLLGSEEKFQQEYGNVFLDPGNSAVGATVIERFKVEKKDPIFRFDNDAYRIFERPNIEKQYVIGVDVGEGIGRASSVAQVLDITDLKSIEQVAIYSTNVTEPYHFANNLVKLCNQWGNPPLLVERNNCGGQVIDALYYKHQYEKIVSCSKISPTSSQTTRNLGILSHTNLRFSGISNMRYWTNTLQVVKINDIDTIKELETFIKYPNGTYRKKNDKFFDDRVLALVWALFILETEICQQYFSIDVLDGQNKPSVISDIGYWDKEERFYGVKEFDSQEIDTPSSLSVSSNPSPLLFKDLDFLPDNDKDTWDYMSDGWTPIN